MYKNQNKTNRENKLQYKNKFLYQSVTQEIKIKDFFIV